MFSKLNLVRATRSLFSRGLAQLPVIIFLAAVILVSGYFIIDSASKLDNDQSAAVLTSTTTTVSTLTKGLVAYYTFDQKAGTMLEDASGNNNAGTLVNGPTWTTGKVGTGALSFNGINQKVTVPASPALNPSTISVAFWSYVPTSPATASSSHDTIIELGNSAEYFRIRDYGNGSIQLRTGGPSTPEGSSMSNNILSTSGSLTYGQWIHWVFIAGPNGLSIYKDGVLNTSKTNPYIKGPDAVLGIGGSVKYSNITLDDLRIYNRTLTPSEIQQLYTGSTVTPTQSTTCTSFTYSAWSACSSGTQTRTVTSASPTGCTGGSPVTTQSCAVTGDTTPPTVSLTSPSSGSTVSGTATITATASDNVAVAGVTFKLDGNNIPGAIEDITSPYSVTWNTTTATNASHTLTAVARDTSGNTTTSTVIPVTVSNTSTFTPTTYTISVTRNGTGTGTVTSGGSINCGTACTSSGASGLSVTLTATPATGSTFTSWSGVAGCSTSPTCTFTLSANTTVTATFSSAVSGTNKVDLLSSSNTVLQSFSTIQACADKVTAGQTCLVYPGTYAEHVYLVRAGGTSETNRVTFKANGIVTMAGFDLNFPYITIDGFDISDAGLSFGGFGYIVINGKNTTRLYPGGDYCKIINNTVRDGSTGKLGIAQLYTDGFGPNNCVISGNHLRNLSYQFLNTAGGNHLVENNTFDQVKGWDAIRFGGHDIVFRGNVVRGGTVRTAVGNHPDVMQTFPPTESYNMLFEKNWFEYPVGAMGQINAGDNTHNYPNVHDFTFRGNVFYNVLASLSISVPHVLFEKNTFYKSPIDTGSINTGGSVTRGDSSYRTFKNNAFIAGGGPVDTYGTLGYYGDPAAQINRNDPTFTQSNSTIPVDQAIYDDLFAQGYLVANGYPGAKAFTLTSATQLSIGTTSEPYRSVIYSKLKELTTMDTSIKATLVKDYNFVTGIGPTYASKRHFSELHGINGGNPYLKNEANPVGPDGIPFTADDGLQPVIGSPLCGHGEGGSTIGAYACVPAAVAPTQTHTASVWDAIRSFFGF